MIQVAPGHTGPAETLHPHLDRSDPNELPPSGCSDPNIGVDDDDGGGGADWVWVVSVACIAVHVFPQDAPAPASHATGPRTSAKPMSGVTIAPSSVDAPMA